MLQTYSTKPVDGGLVPGLGEKTKRPITNRPQDAILPHSLLFYRDGW